MEPHTVCVVSVYYSDRHAFHFHTLRCGFAVKRYRAAVCSRFLEQQRTTYGIKDNKYNYFKQQKNFRPSAYTISLFIIVILLSPAS